MGFAFHWAGRIYRINWIINFQAFLPPAGREWGPEGRKPENPIASGEEKRI